MKVYINNKEMDVFRGARVRDAVLAYSSRSCRMLRNGKLIALDRFGNLTDPDGPLSDGTHLILKKSQL